MSRGNRTSAATAPTPQAVATFLRELATRAEADATLATHLGEALAASGLLPATAPRPRQPTALRGRRATEAATEQGVPLADPYALLRTGGEAALRIELQQMDVPALRQLVRTHRLDPARISARWTARDRLIELILSQLRARAQHGRAFDRV